MTDVDVATLACPLCEAEFEARIALSYSVSGVDVDGCPTFSGDDALGYLVQACLECNFVGPTSEFLKSEDDKKVDTSRLKGASWRDIGPNPPAWKKYMALGERYSHLKDWELAGKAYQNAAWYLRGVEGQKPKEAALLRNALKLYLKGGEKYTEEQQKFFLTRHRGIVGIREVLKRGGYGDKSVSLDALWDFDKRGAKCDSLEESKPYKTDANGRRILLNIR